MMHFLHARFPFVLSLPKHRSFFFQAERKNSPSTSSGRTEEGGGDDGFTLVEMLVALSLFAAIAAIGVGLLRSSVDTQDAVQERLQAMSGINRLRAVIANDLAAALPRATRGPAGENFPAFIGSATGFAFVHAVPAAGGGSRPDVVRTGYALVGDEWRRATQPMLDGAALGEGDRLVDDVTAAALRYRDHEGTWGDSWTSEPGGRLPRAVELRLTRDGRAPLTMIFLTAPTPLPPPAGGIAP